MKERRKEKKLEFEHDLENEPCYVSSLPFFFLFFRIVFEFCGLNKNGMIFTLFLFFLVTPFSFYFIPYVFMSVMCVRMLHFLRLR